MNQSVILVGACLENIELCEDCGIEVVGIIDNNLTGYYFDVPILGSDGDVAEIAAKYSKKVKLSLTQDMPAVRKRLCDYYANIGFEFMSIVSPEARISKRSAIGRGAVVQMGVNIASNTSIGDFANLNTCANIMHDCVIGSFATVAPNAVVLGRVEVGEYVYIGANSTILPNLCIESNAVIGAGAVVTKNVPADATVAGVPAKRLVKTSEGQMMSDFKNI